MRSIDTLDPCDVTRIGGVPATTPALTLIMLGSHVRDDVLGDLVDTAIVRLLGDAHPELWRARNLWEARVLRVLRQARVRDPIPNHAVVVDGQRRVIDFAWPDEMVALEFDGFVPHTTRRVFDDDRVRQNLLVDAGWRIYRLTAAMLRRQPQRSIAPVVRAVARQSVAA